MGRCGSAKTATPAICKKEKEGGAASLRAASRNPPADLSSRRWPGGTVRRVSARFCDGARRIGPVTGSLCGPSAVLTRTDLNCSLRSVRAIRAISWAISSGDRIKSIHPLAIALPGMSGCPAVSGFLSDGDAPRFSYSAQRRCSIAVVTRDNYRDKFAAPVSCKGTEKDRNHVWPTPGLRYRL